jgi:hypothetical protein
LITFARRSATTVYDVLAARSATAAFAVGPDEGLPRFPWIR